MLFLDFMTDANCHIPCWGYSRMTILMIFDKSFQTSRLLWPTRDAICGNAVYHFRYAISIFPSPEK
jgi:hypothetical protein